MELPAIQLTKQALWLVLVLSAPPIAAATVAGLLVAIAQAVTQIQEQTLQFLVRFVAVIVSLFVAASLLGGALYHFSNQIFDGFPGLVR